MIHNNCTTSNYEQYTRNSTRFRNLRETSDISPPRASLTVIRQRRNHQMAISDMSSATCLGAPPAY